MKINSLVKQFTSIASEPGNLGLPGWAIAELRRIGAGKRVAQ